MIQFSTSKYNNMIAVHGRCFLFKGVFSRKEISHSITNVTKLSTEDNVRMGEVMVKTGLGAMLAGSLGMMVGALSASCNEVHTYLIELDGRERFAVKTDEVMLIDYLNWRCHID